MTAVKITAPNHEYTGLSAGVMFSNGVAHIDDQNPQLHWFRQNGYGITAHEDPVTGEHVAAAADPTPAQLTKLSKPELQELARQRSIDFPETATKGDLVGLLRGRDGADGNEPGDQRTGTPNSEPSTTGATSEPPVPTGEPESSDGDSSGDSGSSGE